MYVDIQTITNCSLKQKHMPYFKLHYFNVTTEVSHTTHTEKQNGNQQLQINFNTIQLYYIGRQSTCTQAKILGFRLVLRLVLGSELEQGLEL